MSRDIETVGVCGAAGTMGAGIAIVSARAGFRTICFDRADEGLSKAKEQTAGLYAQKISEAGDYVTLAFDPRGFGLSEGRKGVEDPFQVIKDTQNAVTYMTTLKERRC